MARDTTEAELAGLLRSRRERLQPEDVGLPTPKRRHTPGLRREDVARLAAISTTYYTFLEQGRDVRPSREVLDALAAALRLSPTERAHIHALVHGAQDAGDPPSEVLDPAVAALVERLDPYPTYVSGRCWDVLASNRTARALWTDWEAVDAPRRNMLWWTFTDPAARTVFVEWESEARALLGRFRAATARNPRDPAFAALRDRLHEASREFREWWPRHDVAPLGSGHKQLYHPVLGKLTLRHVVMQLSDDPEQKFVTFTADDSDLARIAKLVATI